MADLEYKESWSRWRRRESWSVSLLGKFPLVFFFFVSRLFSGLSFFLSLLLPRFLACFIPYAAGFILEKGTRSMLVVRPPSPSRLYIGRSVGRSVSTTNDTTSNERRRKKERKKDFLSFRRRHPLAIKERILLYEELERGP